MAQIIAFPVIHKPQPVSAQPAPATDTPDDPAGSLAGLAARMRADAQELTRCLGDLRGAIQDLADADLPGQARALMAQAVAEPRGRTGR